MGYVRDGGVQGISIPQHDQHLVTHPSVPPWYRKRGATEMCSPRLLAFSPDGTYIARARMRSVVQYVRRYGFTHSTAQHSTSTASFQDTRRRAGGWEHTLSTSVQHSTGWEQPMDGTTPLALLQPRLFTVLHPLKLW